MEIGFFIPQEEKWTFWGHTSSLFFFPCQSWTKPSQLFHVFLLYRYVFGMSWSCSLYNLT